MFRGNATFIALLAVGLAAVTGPAGATTRSHRHVRPALAPAVAPRPQRPSSYYPYEVQGGVSGNLPFNNQLRKLSDPLNANGGR